MEYELKVIIDGKSKTVTWEGKDGLNACERYADANRGHTVIAWQEVPVGIFLVGNTSQIIG